MTDALYLDDSSVREFDATVERVLPDGDGETDGEAGRIVLDATHFYPEGGGQPADHGTLRRTGADSAAEDDDGGDGGRVDADGVRHELAVTDVQKRDTVYHHVAGGSLPAAGDRVTGVLDWDRRYAHMRYHTAQHLVSAVLLDEYDARTVGNQLYDDRARIDVEHDRFSETDLADVEALLNDCADRDMAVEWYTMERETAERELDTDRTRIDLLPDSITELRIVEIRDSDTGGGGGHDGDGDGDVFDRTACAGTHVTSTAEVGRFRVTGRETGGAGRERVSFVLD